MVINRDKKILITVKKNMIKISMHEEVGKIVQILLK